MSYYDVSLLAADWDFASRSQAAYATEIGLDLTADDPATWWSQRAWNMAAAPGFGDAYASALAGGVPNPGRDPAVITDGQILSAVQAILGGGQ